MKKLQLVGYIDSETRIHLTKPKGKKKYLRLVIELDRDDIKKQVDMAWPNEK